MALTLLPSAPLAAVEEENGGTDGADPTAAITREQMVTTLWRYAGSPKADSDLSVYADADEISDYAREAFR